MAKVLDGTAELVNGRSDEMHSQILAIGIVTNNDQEVPPFAGVKKYRIPAAMTRGSIKNQSRSGRNRLGPFQGHC
jgi:hypothetical protein